MEANFEAKSRNYRSLKVVDQSSASWNHLGPWLNHLGALRLAGSPSRSSFTDRGGRLRVDLRRYGAASSACIHERRMVAQICPRWNRLQDWFELAAALKDAA